MNARRTTNKFVFLTVCVAVVNRTKILSEVWQEQEMQKPSRYRRDMAFWILTESGLNEEFAKEFPNGNLILREDYQRSFKAEIRFRDTKNFLKE